MFTSMIECSLKPHEAEHFGRIIRGRVLEEFRKLGGFVDLLAIASDARGGRTLAITVRRTKADADRYERAQFAELTSMLKPVVVEGSDVKWSPAVLLHM